MKRKNTLLNLFLLSAIILASTHAYSQNPRPNKRATALDFGIYLGGSNYLGDLTKDYLPVMSETHLAGGLMVRYNLNPSISLRAAAIYMRVSGDDKNFADVDDYREQRNLSFRSNIYEFSMGAEWNLLGWVQTRKSYASSPYLFGSIAVFRFNPMGQFNYMSFHDASLAPQDGKWIELQPLSTEAQETTQNQEKRYSLTQISIPFGFGYKFQINDFWCAGIEFGMRKTFTDYIDDVSTIYWDRGVVAGSGGFMSEAMYDRSREVGLEPFEEGRLRGNSSTKDWYMFAGINITYRILGGKVPCFNFQ